MDFNLFSVNLFRKSAPADHDDDLDPNKITLLLLGSGGSSKEQLLTRILGTVHPRKNLDDNTLLYENDVCHVVCPLNQSSACDTVKRCFEKQNCDLCLLLLDDDFSLDSVWQQINELHKKSKIPLEVIRPVLQPRHGTRSASFSLISVCTVDEVCSQVRPLVDRRATAGNPRKRPALSSGGNQETRGTRVNLVLVGLTGTGKSACGNTILGQNVFLSRTSGTPVTTECQEVEKKVLGTRVRVIDTPDIFNEDMSDAAKNRHVMWCRHMCQGESHVFLLVIQVGRFTDGERGVITELEKAFGPRAREKTIILFTCSEELQRGGMTKAEFLNTCDPYLMRVIDECGHRCVFFENKAQNLTQVKELMHKVKDLLQTWALSGPWAICGPSTLPDWPV